MRKSLLIGAKILLFLTAFGVSLWFFLPWREVGTAALSLGASELEKRGMRLSFSGVSDAEGGFTARDLSLGGFLTLSFQSLTLRPQLLASLMNLAPVCEVEFQGGSVTMGQPMSFGSGGFLLTATPHEVLLERLRADGEFSLMGFVAIDLDKMRIGRAEAALKAPSSFEENMGTLQNFLPLVREGNGNWFLRRAASDGGN
ncbi:MAG: hypothetical protein IJU98_11945 [Synergistaceae bacterium]|nr:hypothetical protein [Synergistaceae bacterium]